MTDHAAANHFAPVYRSAYRSRARRSRRARRSPSLGVPGVDVLWKDAMRLAVAFLVIYAAASMVFERSLGASSDRVPEAVEVSVPRPIDVLSERLAETRRQWDILKAKRQRRGTGSNGALEAPVVDVAETWRRRGPHAAVPQS